MSSATRRRRTSVWLPSAAGTSNISVLRENGTERTKYSGPAQNPGDPAHNPLPWANPANIAFNNKTKSLLVTNHASFTGLPDPSFLFAVFVNDKADKLFKSDDDD
jgi:hypothetical protein